MKLDQLELQTGENAGGCVNNRESFATNPQYMITLTEVVRVIVFYSDDVGLNPTGQQCFVLKIGRKVLLKIGAKADHLSLQKDHRVQMARPMLFLLQWSEFECQSMSKLSFSLFNTSLSSRCFEEAEMKGKTRPLKTSGGDEHRARRCYPPTISA